MMMIKTVGDLKKALAHIPDHYEVWARDIDYYDNEFVVTESTNPLIKSGDLMHIYMTDRYFPDCEKYLGVETNHLPKDHAWKFACIDAMKDSNDFDNMDWRQELDDIRNLGRYNFFHLDSFAKLMDSIKIKINSD